MFPFHICLHARPAGQISAGEPLQLESGAMVPLMVRPEALHEPFSVTFEETVDSLAALPRMFVEPDGSFVWVSPPDSPPWQVDGCLYDRGGRLLYVELKGACPTLEFDQLLRACGWPATPLIFQLVREAAYLDEASFRKLMGLVKSRTGTSAEAQANCDGVN